MDEEKALELFNFFGEEGYDLGDFNNFKSALSDNTKSTELHTFFEKEGFDVGKIENFNLTVQVKKKEDSNSPSQDLPLVSQTAPQVQENQLEGSPTVENANRLKAIEEEKSTLQVQADNIGKGVVVKDIFETASKEDLDTLQEFENLLNLSENELSEIDEKIAGQKKGNFGFIGNIKNAIVSSPLLGTLGGNPFFNPNKISKVSEKDDLIREKVKEKRSEFIKDLGEEKQEKLTTLTKVKDFREDSNRQVLEGQLDVIDGGLFKLKTNIDEIDKKREDLKLLVDSIAEEVETTGATKELQDQYDAILRQNKLLVQQRESITDEATNAFVERADKLNEVENSLDKLGTTKQEIDLLKRNYGFFDNIQTRAGLGFADLATNVKFQFDKSKMNNRRQALKTILKTGNANSPQFRDEVPAKFRIKGYVFNEDEFDAETQQIKENQLEGVIIGKRLMEEAREKLRPNLSVEEINSFGDVIDFTVDGLADNTATVVQLSIPYFGQTSFVIAQQAGNEIDIRRGKIENEKRLDQVNKDLAEGNFDPKDQDDLLNEKTSLEKKIGVQGEQSDLDIFIASSGMALSELVFSRLFGEVKRINVGKRILSESTKKQLKREISRNTKDRFKNIASKSLELGRETGKDALEEGFLDEFLTNTTQNAINKFYLGKEEGGLFDNSLDAIAGGVSVGGVMSAVPRVGGQLLGHISNKNRRKKVFKNITEISKLQKLLNESQDLDETSTNTTQERINTLLKQNGKLVRATITGFDALPKEEKAKLLDLSSRAIALEVSLDKLGKKSELTEEEQLLKTELQEQIQDVDNQKKEIVDKFDNPVEVVESTVAEETQDFASQVSESESDIEDVSQFVNGALKVSVGETEVILNLKGSNIAIESLSTKSGSRGQGSARSAIEKVVGVADQSGKTLELNVVPLNSTTTTEGLIKLYEEVGFVKDEDFDQDDGGRMVRDPKKSEVQQGFDNIDSIVEEAETEESPKNLETPLKESETKKEVLVTKKENTLRPKIVVDFAKELGYVPSKDKTEGQLSFDVDGSKVFLTANKENIVIEQITTPEKNRNKGVARKAIQKITEVADNNGKTLELDVTPLDESTTEEGLINFYKSEGFVLIEGSTKMVREPKSVQTNSNEVVLEGENNVVKLQEKQETTVDSLKEIQKKEGTNSTATLVDELAKKEKITKEEAKSKIESLDKEGVIKIEKKGKGLTATSVINFKDSKADQKNESIAEIETNLNTYSVEVVDGALSITPKLGKGKPSKAEIKKVTNQYIENTNFDKGERANIQEGTSIKQFNEKVLDESQNPQEVAQAILNEQEVALDQKAEPTITIDDAIAETFLGFKISKKDAGVSDLAFPFTSGKSKVKVNSLDAIVEQAQIILNDKNKRETDAIDASNAGVKSETIVSKGDIESFIQKYKSSSDYKSQNPIGEPTNIATELSGKLQQLTGLKPTPNNIEKIAGTKTESQQETEGEQDSEVPFQTESNQERIKGQDLNNLIERLKKTGLAKAVKVLNNSQVVAFLKNLGVNEKVIKQVDGENVNLENWIGDRKELSGVDIQDAKTGEPVVVRAFHGTTNEFYEFDSTEKGNIEGHFGAVNYFTSDKGDAGQNYQSDGADLTSRIDQRAERIEQELEDDYDNEEGDGIDIERVQEDFRISDEELNDLYPSGIPDVIEATEINQFLAERELKGGEDKVLDVYLRMDNPVVVGRGQSLVDVIPKELYEDSIEDATTEIAEENDVTIEEAKEDFQWEIEERAMELAGVENPFIEALQTAINDNTYSGDVNGKMAGEIIADFVYDTEVDLNQLEKTLREELVYAENEDGNLSSSQIISDFFENLGYDGIVMNNPDQRFRSMGIGGGTSHIHIFNQHASNIKLADGTNTTFNENTKDIRFQKDASRNGVIVTPNGFVHDGIVYLNSNQVKADTPIHEFGHLWNASIKETDNAHYQLGLELIKDTEYHEAVKNNPAYANLDEEAQLEEALAQAIGEKGVKILSESKKAKFANWFKVLFTKIAKGLGLTNLTGKQLSDLTLDKYTDLVSAELLAGKEITKNRTDKDVKSKVNEADVTNIELIVTEAVTAKETAERIREQLNNKKFIAKDAKKELVNFIKEQLDSKRFNETRKGELNTILTLVKNTDSKIQLTKALDRVSDVVLKVDNRIMLKAINRILDRKLSKKQSGKRVSGSVAEKEEAILRTVKKAINNIPKAKSKAETTELQTEYYDNLADEANNISYEEINSFDDNGNVIEDVDGKPVKETIQKQELSEEDQDNLLALDISKNIVSSQLNTTDPFIANLLLLDELERVNTIYSDGRNNLIAEKEAKDQVLNEELDTIIGAVDGQNKLDTPEANLPVKKIAERANKNANIAQKAKRIFRNLYANPVYRNLSTTAKRLTKNPNKSATLTGITRLLTEVDLAEVEMNDIQLRWGKELSDAKKKAFGGKTVFSKKNNRYVANKRAELELNKTIPVTYFYKDEDGNNVTVEDEIPQGQALDVILKSKDSSNLIGLEKSGFTQGSIADIESRLSDKVKAYGEEVLDFYRRRFNDVNPVYKRMFFHSLGFQNNFSGRLNLEGQTIPEADMMNPLIVQGVNAKSLKERVNHKNKIIATSTEANLAEYIQQMSRFIAYAEVNQRLTKTLKNEGFQKAVLLNNGNEGANLLDYIKEFQKRHVEGSQKIYGSSFVNFINRNITVAILGGKFKNLPIQSLSFINGQLSLPDNMTPTEWTNAMRDFPKDAIYIFNNSKLIKQRLNTQTAVKAFTSVDDSYAYNPTFTDNQKVNFTLNIMKDVQDKLQALGMTPVRVGDIVGVSGSVPVFSAFKNRIRKQNPELSEQQVLDEAMLIFEDGVNQTQQGQTKGSKSQLQNHPYGRLLVNFGTTIILNINQAGNFLREINKNKRQFISKNKTLRNVAKKMGANVEAYDKTKPSISASRAIKGFANYGFAQPFMYALYNASIAGGVVATTQGAFALAKALLFDDEEEKAEVLQNATEEEKDLARVMLTGQFMDSAIISGFAKLYFDTIILEKEFSFGTVMPVVIKDEVDSFEDAFKRYNSSVKKATKERYKNIMYKQFFAILAGLPPKHTTELIQYWSIINAEGVFTDEEKTLLYKGFSFGQVNHLREKRTGIKLGTLLGKELEGEEIIFTPQQIKELEETQQQKIKNKKEKIKNKKANSSNKNKKSGGTLIIK